MFGEKTSKQIITLLIFFTVIPVYLLVAEYDVGYMDIYFYAGMIVIVYFLTRLWKAKSKKQYLELHNILKFLIVAGVFSVVLIEPSVLVHGRRLLSVI